MSGKNNTGGFSSPHLPTEGSGRFIDPQQRGNSGFIPSSAQAQGKLREFGTDHVTYRNGYPDFSPFTQIRDELLGNVDGQVEIGHMTEHRRNPNYEYGRRTDGHAETEDLGNFAQADNELAKKLNAERGTQLTGGDIEKMRQRGNLTWHEVEDGKTMQLIPTEIHGACPHSGGVSAMRDVHRIAAETEDVDWADDDLQGKNVMEYTWNDEKGDVDINWPGHEGFEVNDTSTQLMDTASSEQELEEYDARTESGGTMFDSDPDADQEADDILAQNDGAGEEADSGIGDDAQEDDILEQNNDDGLSDSGPSGDGPSDSGPSDDGPSDSGPSDSGPSDDGPSDDGPSDDGPSDDGMSMD